MRTFRVRFYFGTDLRKEAVVDANSDVIALVKAMDDACVVSWAVEPGFRIEIAYQPGE
jgi:hypothetical protein